MKNKMFFFLLLMTVFAKQASADPFDRAMRRNLWNHGRNPVGIRCDSISVSRAVISSTYETGSFKDVSSPETRWSVGADARTVSHFDRMTIAGSFSVKNDEMYGMCGSMFIQPGQYPVDIYEFTPGRKSRQDYSMSGGLAVDMGENWRLGLGLDFVSTNLSKRKDLRHTNYALDLQLSPGVVYHSGRFAFGLNYMYSRNTEKIDVEQIGQKDSYRAFLDKGLMYGEPGLWTDASLHLDEAGVSGFPVIQNGHGVAMQAACGDFFVQLMYLRKNGEIGEKQSIWYRFDGDGLSFDLAWRVREHSTLSLGVNATTMSNQESILEKVTAGGVTTIQNYGSNRIYSGKSLSFTPEYVYDSESFELLWKAGIDLVANTLTYKYPYVELRDQASYSTSLSALWHVGHWQFGGALAFSVSDIRDGEYDSSPESGAQQIPLQCDLYSAHLAYLTGPKLCLSPSVRYDFNNGIFLSLYGSIMGNLKDEPKYFPSVFRDTATISLGYNF